MPPRVHILSLDIYKEAQDAPERWCLTAADTESTHSADTSTDSPLSTPRGPGTEQYAAPISGLNSEVQLRRTPMFVGVCTSKMHRKITKHPLKRTIKNSPQCKSQCTSNKNSSFHDLSHTGHRVPMTEPQLSSIIMLWTELLAYVTKTAAITS